MLPINQWFLCHLLSCFLGNVLASYEAMSQSESPIKDRFAAATFIYNNALYTYGGTTRDSLYSNDFLCTSINPNNGHIVKEVVPLPLPGPSCTYSQAVVVKDTVYLFVGSGPGLQSNDTIPIYTYDFAIKNDVWKRVNTTLVGATSGPPVRRDFTATLASNGIVYTYGGSDLSLSTNLNDIWSFDPVTYRYANITQPGQAYMAAHTATALLDGSIVFVTGSTSDNSTSTSNLLDPAFATVYNVYSNQWTVKSIGGAQVNARASASAVLAPDNSSIYLLTGNNAAIDWELEVFNDVFILDTVQWSWSKPDIQGTDFPRRYYGSAGFIDDNHLLVINGATGNIYNHDVNVLRVDANINPSFLWLSTPAEYLTGLRTDTDSLSGLSPGAIAGIVIGIVIFVAALLIIAWRAWDAIVSFIVHLHYNVLWKPRSGEPLWTETCRLISRFTLLVLFLAFFSFNLWQVLSSAKATLTLTASATVVPVPDIRFCFDGWPNGPEVDFLNLTNLGCRTDLGYNCRDFVTLLNASIHQPVFSDQLGDVDCFLFSPPRWFQLSDGNLQEGNGTLLQFTFYGNANVQGAIHVTVYPPGMDPNVVLYNITTTNIPQALTSQQIKKWLSNELNNKQTENIYDLSPSTYGSLSYQIQDHQYLQDNGWNQVGFLPILNHTAEVTTLFRPGVTNPMVQANSYMIGRLAVFPNDYALVTLREQKVFSLLNALGFVGGVFSLFVAVQAWLFGFRPNSPWGVVHRWSVGTLKRSIKQRLRNQFDSLRTPIPLVNPVHHRFSALSPTDRKQREEAGVVLDPMRDDIDQDNRLDLMERRMQLMELLFKSYYINDEIFKELDSAVKQKQNNDLLPLLGRSRDISMDSSGLPSGLPPRIPPMGLVLSTQGPSNGLGASHHSSVNVIAGDTNTDTDTSSIMRQRRLSSPILPMEFNARAHLPHFAEAPSYPSGRSSLEAPAGSDQSLLGNHRV